MAAGEIWVIRSGKRWFVTQQGKAGRLGDFSTEEAAIAKGRELAAAAGFDLLIKTEKGWQRERSDDPQRTVAPQPQKPVEALPPARPAWTPTTSSRDIWVVPEGDGWGLKLEQSVTSFLVLASRSEAVLAGRELAKEAACGLVILNEDARVEGRESYLPITKSGSGTE